MKSLQLPNLSLWVPVRRNHAVPVFQNPIEHNQIPKESNNSSAVWNRKSSFAERSWASCSTERVSAGIAL